MLSVSSAEMKASDKPGHGLRVAKQSKTVLVKLMERHTDTQTDTDTHMLVRQIKSAWLTVVEDNQAHAEAQNAAIQGLDVREAVARPVSVCA
jgi:hypothetical protein